MNIYDKEGNLRDWAWLQGRFGAVAISALTGAGWYVDQLREIEGPSAQVHLTRDAQGRPQSGVKVAFYWPDAPEDANAGPGSGLPAGIIPNRCVYGTTNTEGVIGFGMGPGAYYWPDQGQTGPHACWIYGSNTRSQVVTGIGMLGGTAHIHLDVVWRYMEQEPEPPPDPEPPPEPPPPPPPPPEVPDAPDEWQWLSQRLDIIIAELQRSAVQLHGLPAAASPSTPFTPWTEILHVSLTERLGLYAVMINGLNVVTADEDQRELVTDSMGLPLMAWGQGPGE